MLGLKLREEFLGDHMPGTAISLRTSDNQGAVQKSPDYILSISYPTADVQTALKAICAKRNGRPIVLMGERDALRFIRSKAFKTGQELRQVILGLPGDVGGGALPGLPSSQTTVPDFNTGTIPQPVPLPNAEEQPGGAVVADGGEVQSGNETTPAPLPKTHVRRSDEPATAINLSGCFEKWGIPSDKTIGTARIEFTGISAQHGGISLLEVAVPWIELEAIR